ncbi:MAG TPA: hypothetical protein VK280_13390 [Streptosporangiaceae bacterium]|nr:hypothetical protein [Streptosporangiaceae bacterium]
MGPLGRFPDWVVFRLGQRAALEPACQHLDRLGERVHLGLEQAQPVKGAFTAADLEWLAGSQGFGERDLEVLRRLQFTGEVWAVPEGTAVFAGEPLVEVTAPIPEAQLAETCC